MRDEATRTEVPEGMPVTRSCEEQYGLGPERLEVEIGGSVSKAEPRHEVGVERDGRQSPPPRLDLLLVSAVLHEGCTEQHLRRSVLQRVRACHALQWL